MGRVSPRADIPVGGAAGCNRVNEEAWTLFEGRYRNTIRSLRISEASVHQQFTHNFNIQKTMFPNKDPYEQDLSYPVYGINIVGNATNRSRPNMGFTE